MLSKQIKLDIYKAVEKESIFWGNYSGYQQIMTFLSNVWPLRTMESKDSRYTNAYDDVVQHYINNNDWTTDELILDRLDLIEGDEIYFIAFINQVLHPLTRKDLEEINQFVTLTNRFLVKDDYSAKVTDYFEELPVYTVSFGLSGTSENPTINQNIIPFFKEGVTASRFPCFVLNYNSWNDYGAVTTIYLEYYSQENDYTRIGKVKVMRKGVDKTWDHLPNFFEVLEPDWCSLGQSISYYQEFKELLPDTYQSALLALRDVGMYPRIYEDFYSDATFKKSLIRDREPEALSRTARFMLREITSDPFKFNFIFKPPFSDENAGINLFFDFEHEGDFQHRIYAVIGQNGTGKTALLTGIVHYLSRNSSLKTTGELPLFGKIFTISYSAFDRFVVPQPNAAFNYTYCGLRKGDETLKSIEDQIREFYISVKAIYQHDRDYDWFIVLSKFLSDDVLLKLFPNYESEIEHGSARLDDKGVEDIIRQMSSGETIFLFTITRIVSEIRNQSLILYDEPETHLHPNAVSSLMNALFTLVHRFDSFCIIATHSPLIVRELTARNVFVLKREANEIILQPLEKDSFGENLTVITEEIFGTQDINKHYMEEIRTMVQKNLTYDAIVERFSFGNLPISLNARLYIRSLLKDKV